MQLNRPKWPVFISFLCLVLLIWKAASPILSVSLDEEIANLGKKIAELEASITPLKKESSNLQAKISQAKSTIFKMESQITDLSNKLVNKEADLEVQKTLLSERVRRYYINSKKFNPLLIFFASSESSSLLRQYSFYQAVIGQDRSSIITYVDDITSLSKNKANLESERTKLSAFKKSIESRFGYLSGEIKKAETYKQELSKRQQQLIAEKTAMFTTSVGDVSSSDDPASRADYNPGFSPAFAAFSFGAPHRKGMSQYGAYGRAKSGQNYETILKAYYGDIKIEKMDSPSSIKTSVGTIPFEDNYLVGIAEMPASWGDQGGYEALKAQAIAARTYAISYTNNLNGSICVTEACQVYSRSRYNSPGTWKKAVEETRGLVVKSNQTGKVFSTMYASTSGGSIVSYTSVSHSTPQVWDSSCGNQSCWPSSAFEKVSGSPWFYKGWYKTRSNAAYGRSHPWLNNEEFSDIVNAVLYFSKTRDSSHLSQINNCIGSCDGSAWSRDELRRQVADKGGPISSVNSVNVDYSTSGITQSVRLSTDKGDFNFTATEFKDIFVLRAPGAIAIKSSLFNIEKK